ncbi:hypothetical protein TCAL_13578 [Tigriopus californicus]|uniref:Ig-like domain-containing protein n=1 Tax=Tigriopus californicus TaxID=6832 RepID=A0A553NPU4_TIGCA|nr:hypothetical protein TCAL_13578 [Tigriopus californicus]
MVPHVRIQGSPDIHVNQGSVINLTCIISYSPEAPAFIFWYHGDQVVPYDSESGRFSVNTEKLGRETRSHLVIYDASPNRDSGNYTCKPSIAKAASIKVHVLERTKSNLSRIVQGSNIQLEISTDESDPWGEEKTFSTFNVR